MSDASDDDGRAELPTGWEWKKLGEIVRTSSGGTPSRTRPEFYEDGTVPWLKIGDLNDGVVDQTAEQITEEALAGSSAKKLPAGTLVIAMYGSIGKLGVLGVEAATNQAICALQVGSEVLSEYLFWYLRGQRRALLAAGFGGTQANISQTFLKQLAIPLPPLDEQRKIVERIDTTMSMIEAAAVDLVQGKNRLGDLRGATIRSVLAGSLRSFPREVGQELARPEREQLGTVAEIQYGWTAKSSSQTVGPKMLRITDIQYGRVQWEDVPHCEIPQEKLFNYQLSPGDIVFTRSGATTGKSYLVGDDVPEAVFASYLIRVRPHERLRSDFLALFFEGADYWDYVRRHSKGMAQPNLNGSLLGELEVPVPSLTAQQAAVAAAQRQLRGLDMLAAEIGHAESRRISLQSSLRHAAFSGRLSSVVAGGEAATESLGQAYENCHG